jgi:4-hydroxybenzoate polyprenyltransferase
MLRGMDPQSAAESGSGRRGRTPLAVARAWWLLPHPVPIVVVLAATTGFAWLVRRGHLPIGDLVVLVAAMLGGQLAIGAVNEIADVELDRAAKPHKPIPAGLISVRAAGRLALAGLALMVLCGARFGAASLLLLATGTGLGLAYDLWFKRTALSWLPYALALPLLPIWVRTALAGFDPRLLLLYPLGAAATVGVHLAQALPDAATDRAAGLDNLVSRAGERRSVGSALALTATAPALAAALAASPTAVVARPDVVLLGAIASAIMIATCGLVYAADRALGVRACFPLLAMAVVAIGFAWVVGSAG